jgi:predicted alpha-1,2-mannosidase
MRSLFLCFLTLIIFEQGPYSLVAQENPAAYVNPFIGTGGHGHTFPGACLPFGMVQLSPDTRLEGWDGCSAYHFDDDTIFGFSHTHLSGTGVSDYGDILLMPVRGICKLWDYEWRSAFRHENETASPGYYSVFLEKHGIFAELTATRRCGLHRYTFQESSDAAVVLDLKHRDQVIESSVKWLNDTTLTGIRRSKAWAVDQQLHFAIVFSAPIREMLISSDDGAAGKRKSAKGTKLKVLLSFGELKDYRLQVKVGISAVSEEGAMKNLKAEIPSMDFPAVLNQAVMAWETELGRIRIENPQSEAGKIFYTALYHSFLSPNLFSDVDGRYRGMDGKVHQADGWEQYTVFSLWDTYRATHPLFTIVQEKRTRDFIQTFLAQYRDGGRLPVWELAANETECMIGYHSVSVIADAYLKGIRGYDSTLALEAMKHSAMLDHFGLGAYKSRGYISSEDLAESVSRTLEYAYDDWCIAQMARSLGQENDYREFSMRAQNWKNLFDPETGFFRARYNGGFTEPFDPAEVNNHYTEANAWQYSNYVPHDINTWSSYLGGKERMAEFLDRLFSADPKTTGRQQADITGLIGQYAHGNEPSHHMAYLYVYAGQAWKTQELVSRIRREMYSNKPDGLSGNEDCGQMSAWYVMSALGFYPVCPGSDIYIIGSPEFGHCLLSLENGKEFRITAENADASHPYIQSATLNGEKLERAWIRHGEIMQGGELVFVMGPEPNKDWGCREDLLPRSEVSEYLIKPVPYVLKGSRVISEGTKIVLACADTNAAIHYSIDGSEPDASSPVYNTPVVAGDDIILKALASGSGDGSATSKVMTSVFTRAGKGPRVVRIAYPYAPQYAAGGQQALADGIRGGEDYRTGAWQGFEGVNLDVVLDLGSMQEIASVTVRFLQDERSWIFMPLSVDFYHSEDGEHFTFAGKVENRIPALKGGSLMHDFSRKIRKGPVRYIRVVGISAGVCPDGHPGAGKPSWIFADEIIIDVK